MSNFNPFDIEHLIDDESFRLNAAIEAEVKRLETEAYIKQEAQRRLAERQRLAAEASRQVAAENARILEEQRKASALKAQLELEKDKARIKADADIAAAEQHRLAVIAMGEKKAAVFANWIRTAFVVDSHPQAGECVYEILRAGWTQQSLEVEFWKWLDEHGGFSKCPTCGKPPKVVRKNEFTIRLSGQRDVNFQEGLWNAINGNGDLFHSDCQLYNINCCEHLYDFKERKRYVLASYVCVPKPTKSFNVFQMVKEATSRGGIDRFGRSYGPCYDSIKRIQSLNYVPFNPEDPTGAKEKAILESKEKEARIIELRKALQALESTQ